MKVILLKNLLMLLNYRRIFWLMVCWRVSEYLICISYEKFFVSFKKKSFGYSCVCYIYLLTGKRRRCIVLSDINRIMRFLSNFRIQRFFIFFVRWRLYSPQKINQFSTKMRKQKSLFERDDLLEFFFIFLLESISNKMRKFILGGFKIELFFLCINIKKQGITLFFLRILTHRASLWENRSKSFLWPEKLSFSDLL